MWVPPCLWQRFRDYDNACFLIKKGSGDFKAKIKYGETDFVLTKKSPTCRSWTVVVPAKLSPLDPSASSYVTPSSSPPLGRSSRTKRKTRSPLNSSSSRFKASRLGSPGHSEDETASAEAEAIKDNLNY